MKYLFTTIIAIALLTGCSTKVQKPSGSNPETADSLYLNYMAKGDKVVKLSFAALSHQLQMAIGERGLGGALSFCNVHALPITDSLSESMGVNISRTGLRYRNQENAPDPLDVTIMLHFQNMIAQSGKAKDTLIVNEKGEYVYLAPIYTLPACLQCHGVPEVEIKPQTMELIRSLYPDDIAIGFREGELRGMWKVKFDASGSTGQ